jgi:hypothetical protein
VSFRYVSNWFDNIFPEELTIRWFLLPNHPYFKEIVRDNFLEGYRRYRKFDYDDLVEKMAVTNHDNYEDLYYKGKLIKSGARSNKRLRFLPENTLPNDNPILLYNYIRKILKY